MDNIIFEDPSKRVSRKNKVGSNVALPVARCDMAIEQAPQPIDPYFSHDTNFNVYIHGKEPVSLFDMFSLSGDEELGNEDLTNESPQALSQGNINGQREWSVSVSREPAEEVIPIDPAILGKESVSEKNADENVALDCSGSSYPTSPKSLALHRHAQIVEDSAPVSDANSDTRRLPSKRRLAMKLIATPPANDAESRKGKSWEPDEIKLLVQLKEAGSPWSVIAKRFQERFPGRSKGSIQVYWSTKLQYLH
ncbi:hypothetical protein TSTA_053020 [Talaromyces stipitatus ATCC 10500]|uniref:Myb-like domain-containing protein n=1 Tax=Talaromyces stipitatus (strain ATCC 10500 / CBS 375.48 / QM 6759 / NRRL 1006) TaxID=441959 RepID=B8MQU9_TALSN|nr:uncharacterized protein TSTA_053020 [Talaromyces stipitatus ATCC 10500]EED12784.1 hypothetical protein TSTA_053020 [Talaromyces stipitatus ATCC 10500]